MAELKMDFEKMAKGFTKTAEEKGMFVGWWIPVSERLPDPQEYGDENFSEWVLISLHFGDNNVVSRAYYCFTDKKWYSERFAIGDVVAWMPLPEPYKVESEE